MNDASGQSMSEYPVMYFWLNDLVVGMEPRRKSGSLCFRILRMREATITACWDILWCAVCWTPVSPSASCVISWSFHSAWCNVSAELLRV